MKKNYRIPTIDIAEIRFCGALLEGSVGDNEKPGQSTTPEHGAPKRRLF